MTDDKDLLFIIQSKMMGLSKGQKKIANFLLEHYDKAVYVTAAELARQVGVSESTVVRFAIEIGFDGYPKLQRALDEMVKGNLIASKRMAVSSDRIFKQDKHILKAVLESDLQRIQSTIDEVDEQVFDLVIDQMIGSDKIYIVGGRSSATLASFFSFYLNYMLDNVINVSSTSVTDVFEQIYRIKQGDLFIGISFPRYSQKTIKAMEFAHAQKATTVAITDSSVSPLYKHADYTLVSTSSMISLVDSLVAPLSLINAIIVAVSIKKKEEVANTLDKLESLWNEYQVYASNVSNKYLK